MAETAQDDGSHHQPQVEGEILPLVLRPPDIDPKRALGGQGAVEHRDSVGTSPWVLSPDQHRGSRLEARTKINSAPRRHIAWCPSGSWPLRGSTNARVEHGAVGASPGSLRLYRKSNASVVPANRLSKAMFNRIYGVETVRTLALDDYALTRDLSPTVLKLDVEGFEGEALKGASELLSRAPKLAVEIHTELLGRYGTSVEEMFGLMSLDRYRVWVQWDERQEPVEFDGRQAITSRVHLFAVPH